MDSLSPELVREIFQHLNNKSDIVRFRLVQRTFAELGKEFLFSCLYVQPSQHSLSRLLEVSRHLSCAQHVRTVSLSVDAMVWKSFTEQVGSENIGKIDYRTLIIFRSIVRECQEFQQSSDYAAMLTASFSRLPRLSKIFLHQASSVSPRCSEAVTLMDRYAHTVDPPHFHGLWGEKDYLRAFSALIDAAYFAGIVLETFSTDGPIDQALFDNPTLLSRARSVFRNCRVLKLRFCGEEPPAVVNGYSFIPRLLESQLFDVLAPVEELKSLTVEFSACSLPSRGRVLSTKILGNGAQHIWPKLREVNLGTIDLPYKELLLFLERHKATLRGLTVSGCNLVNGSWCDVMIFLKKNMTLTKLELSGTLLDEGTEMYSSLELEMMVDYILNRGELPPSKSLLN